MRTLTLISPGLGRENIDTIRTMEKSDRHPRITLFEEALNTDFLDERFLLEEGSRRRKIYEMLNTSIAQVYEAGRIQRRYDAVISWSVKLGILYAAMRRMAGLQTPHIVMASWISKKKKAMLLRRLHPWIDRIILWSPKQYDFAVKEIGFPESKISLISLGVDHQFWRPMSGTPGKTICSVGYEMRDYSTLLEALRGTGIRCHIAAGTARKVGNIDARLMPARKIPPGVTIGRKSHFELRELYAQSRFVVIPLKPTDTDNGISAILEAMAMGKAVICSAVEGQRDMIRHGLNGLMVPPGDAAALREAILYLYEHPEAAERMGSAGRAHILRRHSIEGTIEAIRQIVEKTIEAKHERRRVPVYVNSVLAGSQTT